MVDAIQDARGVNIVSLDMRELGEAPTDYFVICEGESSRKVRSISDKVQEMMLKKGNDEPLHLEGKETSRWILLDYFNVVVHIFHPEAREFYQLDELWGDADRTSYEEKTID